MPVTWAPPWGSWDLHLGDRDGGGALGDEERQQRERVRLGRGVDRPPDRVAAGGARGQRRAVAERALVAPEGRERDAALVLLRGGGGSGNGACDEPPSAALTRHWGATLIRDPGSALGVMLARGTRHGHGRRAARRTRRGARRARARRDRAEGAARPAALVVLGEPGIGKTRLLAELAAARRRARAASCCPAAPPSSSPTCRSGCSWTRSTSTWRGSIRAGWSRSRTTCAPSSRGCSPRCPSSPARASRRSRTSATARIAPCASCSSALAATKPLVLVLDDVHWADSASIELLGALLRRPPAAAVLLALGARPRQLPERLAAALERARPRRLARRASSWARSSATRPAQLLGERPRRGARGRALRGERRQPVLPRAARPVAAPAGGRRGGRARTLGLGGVEVPARGGRRADRGARAAPEPTRAPARGRRRGRRPVRARARGRRGGDRRAGGHRRRSTSCSRATSSGRPTCRAASASATRWCARAVYETAPGGWRARRPRALRGGARRSAARRAAARAHHVEHAARQGDAEALAVPARRPAAASTLRAPASAARWFGAALRLLPDDAPPEERVGAADGARRGPRARRGQLEESRADLLETLGLVPDDAGGAAGAAHGRLRRRRALPRPPRAGPRAPRRRRSSELPDPAAPEAVALMVELAVDGLFRADYEAMREFAAARARGRASRSATTPLIGHGARRAGARVRVQRRHRRGGEPPRARRCPRRRDARRRAGRPHRRGRLPRRGRALPRPLSRGGRARRARRSAVGARDRAACSPRSCRPSAPRTSCAAGLPRRPRCSTAALEAARLGGHRPGVAWSARQPLDGGARRRRRRDGAVACAEEAMELTARARRELHLGLGRRRRSPPRCCRVRRAGRAPSRSCSSAAGGEELPLDPRRLARDGARAAHPLPPGARPPRRRRARPRQRAEATAAAVGLPMAAAWAERAAAAVALDGGRCGRGGRASARLGRRRRARPARWSRPRCPGRSPGGRSREAGDGDAGRRRAGARGRGSTPAARPATATRRSGSCASWAGASTAARARATRGSDRRSPSLSERELEVARLVVDRKTNARSPPSCS